MVSEKSNEPCFLWLRSAFRVESSSGLLEIESNTSVFGREVTLKPAGAARWWMGLGTIGVLVSSRHKEARFILNFGEYSSFSKDEDEVDALGAAVEVLVMKVGGVKASTDFVTRCSGDAGVLAGGDLGSGLPAGESRVEPAGAVLERFGVPRASSVGVTPASDTAPPTLFSGGLVLIPCATFASLSLTFVGEKVSFLGGGGACGKRAEGIAGDATADEGTEDGDVMELISMSGLGNVLFVAVDIALPGLRGPTRVDSGASSSEDASESDSEVSLSVKFRFGAANKQSD